MPIDWTKPSVPNAPTFARIGHGIVGYVNRTAFEDGRWSACVLPAGPDHRGMFCYVATEAKGKEYVERWLQHHAPDASTWDKQGKPPWKGEA